MLKSKRAKRAWIKPMLTIMVRGKPGERVLTVCKMPGFTYSVGFENSYYGCQSNSACWPCEWVLDS